MDGCAEDGDGPADTLLDGDGASTRHDLDLILIRDSGAALRWPILRVILGRGVRSASPFHVPVGQGASALEGRLTHARGKPPPDTSCELL